MLAKKAGITFAQFVMMTPFPGTVDFDRWEKNMEGNTPEVGGVPITRYWLIPAEVRPKMFTPHGTMSTDEIRERTQGVWDQFLQHAGGLGALEVRADIARTAGVCVHFEAVSADVCEYRDLDG